MSEAVTTSELPLVVRPCPSCGSSGELSGAFMDKDHVRYGLPDLPVPLRRCVSCRLRFFDLIQGVNTAGEIYSRMTLSTSAAKPRHFAFQRLIQDLWHSSVGLELGAGSCHVGRLLDSAKHSVIALDRYAQQPEQVGGIQFIDGDLGKITQAHFRAKSFDWILIDNVLEHLPAFRTVLDCSRVWLRDEGCLFVSVPNGRTLKRFAGEKHRGEIYRPVEHVNIFDGATLDRAISKSAFKRRPIAFVPKSPFESSVLASLFGVAPLGLYRVYSVVSLR